MRNKIAIIIPYFGKFPVWMSLFVEGCKNNDFIDFIIYSDDSLYQQQADNIIFHRISFDNYCTLIKRELNIEFAPLSPYKLCGVRPFYGYIHRAELKDYQFWGYCDLDLVFGDMRTYFTKDNLQKFDVISTDWDRISGPLCIIRNTEYYRTIGFRIPKWKQMLESDKMIPLDEKYFSDIIAKELKLLRGVDSKILRPLFPLKWVRVIDKILARPIHSRLKKRRLLFSFKNCTPEIGYSKMKYVYANHVIYDRETQEKLIYLHFLFFKKNKYRTDFLWKDEASLSTSGLSFDVPVYIDEHGIYN